MSDRKLPVLSFNEVLKALKKQEERMTQVRTYLFKLHKPFLRLESNGYTL